MENLGGKPQTKASQDVNRIMMGIAMFILMVALGCRAKGVFHVTVPAPEHIHIFQEASGVLTTFHLIEDLGESKGLFIPIPQKAFNPQSGEARYLTCQEILGVQSENEEIIASSSVVLSDTVGGCLLNLRANPNAYGEVILKAFSVHDPEEILAISVVVDAVNDDPQIAALQDQTTDEDVSINQIPVNINDVDSTLSCSAIGVTSSNPLLINPMGVSFTGDAPSCLMRIAPELNQSGIATLTLSISDSISSTSSSFLITVNAINDFPQITHVNNFTLISNVLKTQIPVTVTDVDSVIDCTTFSVTSSSPAVIPAQNLAFSGTAPDCVMSVISAPNQIGSSTIGLAISDGSLPANDTFTITVKPPNTPPTISAIQSQTMDEDSSLSLTVTMFDQETLLTCGAISASSSNPSLIPNTRMSFSGAVPDCSLTLNPNPNQSGTAQITLTVSDGSLTATSSIILTVNSVPDQPTNISLSGNLIAENSTVDTLMGDLSGVDADPLETFTFSLVPGSGDTDNADFKVAGTQLLSSIVPDFETKASYTIRLQVTDSTGLSFQKSQIITVSNVNEPPTLVPLADQTTLEDSPLVLPLTVSDPDGNLSCEQTHFQYTSSDPRVLASSGALVASGTWPLCIAAFTPVLNQSGTTTVNLSVSDGSLSQTQSFPLTVNPVNDPPTLSQVANQSTTENVALSGISVKISDVDSTLTCGALTATAANPAMIAPNGYVFSGTAPDCFLEIVPATNQSGSSNITLTATDGSLSANKSFLFTINPVNDAPTDITLSNLSIQENSGLNAIVGVISATDSDLNSSFIYNLVQGTGDTDNSSFNISADKLRLSASANFEVKSTYQVRLRVTDNGGLSFEKAFVVTISDVNESPSFVTSTLTSASLSTSEDAPVSLSLIAFDPDGNLSCDQAHFSYQSSDILLLPQPNAVTFSGTWPNCQALFSPALHLSGVSTLTLTVTDGFLSFSQAISLTVTPVNNPPSVVSDSPNQVMDEDTVLNQVGVTISDIDSVVSCNALTFTTSNPLLILPSGLTATGTAPQCYLSLTPLANASGQSLITVTVSDGSLSALDSFTLTVNQINDQPQISNVPNQSTLKNTSLIDVPVSVSDLETAISCSSISVSSSDQGVIPISGVSFTGTAPQCLMRLDPVAQAIGSSTIVLTVTDSALTSGGTPLSASDSFIFTVLASNTPPSLSAVADQTTNEDVTVTVPITISDLETTLTCGSLSASATNQTLFPASSLVITGTVPNCSLSLQPSLNASGSSNINLSVTDGSLTTTGQFAITVNSVNDAPTGILLSQTSLQENLAPNALVGLLSAIDVDLSETHTFSLVPGLGSTDNSSFTITGNALSLNPLADFESKPSYTLRIRATDSGSLVFEKSFVVTILNVNEAPIMAALFSGIIINEDFHGAVNFSASDPDGPLSCSDIYFSFTSSNQSLIPSPTGLTFGATWPSCGMAFNPNANAFGSSSITLTLSDGALSTSHAFTLTVNPVNDLPQFTSIADTVIAEDTGAYTLQFSISDVESSLRCDTVTVSSNNLTLIDTTDMVVGGGATSSCSLALTPKANQNGSGVITLSVFDGTDYGTISFNLTVNPINDAPSISVISGLTTPTYLTMNENSSSPLLSFSVSDIDSTVNCNSISVSSTNTGLLPINAMMVSGGTTQQCGLVLTPSANSTGSSLVTVNLTDGSLTASRSFTVDVLAVNDPPVFSLISDQTILEDTPLSGLSFSVSDPDSSLNCASITASSDDTVLIANASITVSGGLSQAGGTAFCSLSLTPASNQNTGPATITLQISDEVSTSTGTFKVFVTPVNDIPVRVSLGATSYTILEDSGPLSIALGSFTDPDSSQASLQYTVVTTPSLGQLTLPLPSVPSSLTAALTYTPDLNANGSTTLVYKVCDGNLPSSACSSPETINLSITPVNDPPALQAISAQSGNRDTPLSVPLQIIDPDSPTALCSASTYTSQTTTVVAASGAVAWSGTWPNCVATITPVAGAQGSSLITITVSDGLMTSSQSFTLSVNNPPLGWYQEAYIKAANADASDLFGLSVSISGSTIIVGSPGEASSAQIITNGTTASANNTRPLSGASYIYKRTGSNWAQEAYVKASNAGSGDSFGTAVAISGDTAIIGDPGEDSSQTTITNSNTSATNNTAVESGAGFVYLRNGLTWSQQAFLKPSNGIYTGTGYPTNYGASVAISGETSAVGVRSENSPQTFITNGTATDPVSNPRYNSTGATLIYKRTTSVWAQEAYLKAANADSNDLFGASVSLSGDTAVVGAPYESSNQTTITNGTVASTNNGSIYSGAVYVFKRTGSFWSPEAYIKSSNSQSSDLFGTSVFLSSETLVVGAPAEDSSQTTVTNGILASSNTTSIDSGAAYIFQRTGSIWSGEAYLKASNADASVAFGSSVAISGDTVVVGAIGEASAQTFITNGTYASLDKSSPDSGAGYIFRKVGGIWASEAYIKASNTKSIVGFRFAESLGISGDTIVVGASIESSPQTTITNGISSNTLNTLTSSGAVYVYRNLSRGFEVYDVVSSATTSSFTVSWRGSSLGTSTGQFKVVYGTTTPSVNCTSGAQASSGVASTATVSAGLTPGQTYIVRICSSANGVNYTEGVLTTVTIKGDSVAPTILSIRRGTVANPVPNTVNMVDFVVTFSEPVIGVNTGAFTFTEVSTATGATGNISSLSCSGAICTIFARVGNPGQLRLDLTKPVGISDLWGNGLATTRIGDETYTLSAVWYQEAYIKASNADGAGWFPYSTGFDEYFYGDQFGASLSISGDTAIVGSKNEGSNQTIITNGATSSANDSMWYAGASYVFKRTGSTWAQQAYIKASNAWAGLDRNGIRPVGTYFGGSVDIDADTAIVGSIYERSVQTTITNGTTSSADASGVYGAAYVYKRTGTNWAQEAYLKSSVAGYGINFGSDVAISGNTAVVAAIYEGSSQTTITNGTTASTVLGSTQSGAVYIYSRTGSLWSQQAYVKASNANFEDQFSEVAISADTVIVGAPAEDSNQVTVTNGPFSSSDNSASNSGAVYVYRKNGARWYQEAYLKPSNADPADSFGSSVDISGNTIVVSAPKESSNQLTITNGSTASSDNSALNTGAAYIFQRDAESWSQKAYIKPASTHQSFSEVSISGDTVLVFTTDYSPQTYITSTFITSDNISGGTAGAVYVFKRTASLWDQEGFIKASNSLNGLSGVTSISGDTIVVGALSDASSQITITNGTTSSANNSLPFSGAVYVYRNKYRLFEVDNVSTDVTATSFTVNWQGTSLGKSNGNYKVVYATTVPGANCSSGNVAYSGTLNTTTVSVGLVPGQTYFVRICSFDGLNYSEGITSEVTVKLESVAPTVLSINRGGSPNPVPYGTSVVDFTVNFSEPVVGLETGNFTLTEPTVAKGATGKITDLSCSGAVCTVTVIPGNSGMLRLDLSNVGVIADVWGNRLTTTRVGDQSYTLDGWYQEAYLKASNANASATIFDGYGSSLSISGNTLIVGARQESSPQITITNGTTSSAQSTASYSGAAYVYNRVSTAWTQQAYIKASNAESGDFFGEAASLSGDTAIVGANGEDSPQTTITNGSTSNAGNTASNSGAAYVYKRNGSLWSQEAYLKASNVNSTDGFGGSVAISGDTAVVGAPGEASLQSTITNGITSNADNTAAAAGAVYVYQRTGSSWAQQAYIKASNPEAGDVFGESVAISGDSIVVGSKAEDSSQTTISNGVSTSVDNTAVSSGASYIFNRSGSLWYPQAYIKASNANASDEAGDSLYVSGDTVIVGAINEDAIDNTITNGSFSSIDNSNSSSGAAYIYRRTNGVWAQEAYLKASNNKSFNYFGSAVSLSGHTAVVGAYYESSAQTFISNGSVAALDSLKTGSGASYVFKRSGVSWEQFAFLKASNADAGDSFGSTVSISGDSVAVTANSEQSQQTTIINGPTSNTDNPLAEGAVYVYRFGSRVFDPDLRVSAKTANSITLSWSTNLGSAVQVKIAPSIAGSGVPLACSDPGAITLAAGTTSYTYSGLTTATKYGFRVCGTDGTNVSEGAVIWDDTL